MATSKEHTEFIRLVSEGVTFEKAFVTTCNKNATSSYARSYGSRLAKKYAKQIELERNRIQAIITSTKDDETLKNALNGILSQAEVDKKLCDIINGDFVVNDVAIFQGSPIPFMRQPNASEVKGAIDSYYKRFGLNAPTQIKSENSTTVNWSEQKTYDSNKKANLSD